MAVLQSVGGAGFGFLELCDTLDTSVTKSDNSLPIVKAGSYREVGERGSYMRTSILELNTLIIAEGGAAAKAFGQKIATFPIGRIVPIGGEIALTLVTAATTVSATWEVGLGSVIGSGANATLGAVGATSEDIMEGTSDTTDITTTAISKVKSNAGVLLGTQGATAPSVIDGSSTAVPLYFNIAGTWGAAENLTISNVKVTVHWLYMGRGA